MISTCYGVASKPDGPEERAAIGVTAATRSALLAEAWRLGCDEISIYREEHGETDCYRLIPASAQGPGGWARS